MRGRIVLMVVLVVVVLAFSLSVEAKSKKKLIQTGVAWTLTGTYDLFEVNIFQIQRLWWKKGIGSLKVTSFLDWKEKKIYYVSEKSLKVELYNAQSYRNLIEAAEGDQDAASESMRAWLGAGRSISPRW